MHVFNILLHLIVFLPSEIRNLLYHHSHPLLINQNFPGIFWKIVFLLTLLQIIVSWWFTWSVVHAFWAPTPSQVLSFHCSYNLWCRTIIPGNQVKTKPHYLKGLLRENLSRHIWCKMTSRSQWIWWQWWKNVFSPSFSTFLQNSRAYCHPDPCRVSISCHSDKCRMSVSCHSDQCRMSITCHPDQCRVSITCHSDKCRVSNVICTTNFPIHLH